MLYRLNSPFYNHLYNNNPVKASSQPCFVLFAAERSAPNNERWCPDCTSADPIIDEALQSAPAGATLLEVLITKPEWKNDKNHFLRKPPLSVSGIPTLAVYDLAQQKISQRFVEGECEQLEALQAVFMGSNFDSHQDKPTHL